MRIVIGNLGSALLEQLHDAIARRRPLIIDIRFVSETQTSTTRSVHGYEQRSTLLPIVRRRGRHGLLIRGQFDKRVQR